ncbi:MAG: YhjD/YihY/BrkB family envelope integrity protein [Planctomycetota bacterium]
MTRLLDYLIGAVRRPREQLSRGQAQLRYAWELTLHCGRQLSRHRAEGMAAELTYRTIFSLIPVVVLGLVMFRIVGGLEDVQGKVENQLFSFFGVPELPTEYLDPVAETTVDPQEESQDVAEDPGEAGSPPEDSSETGNATQPSDPDTALQQQPEGDRDPSEAPTGVNDPSASTPDVAEDVDDASKREARASIRRTIHDLAAKIMTIDFASIGIFGLLLFVYAAVALADSTEQVFNRIFAAPKSRPIHIRVAIHWSIITLGSGLLAMSLYMSSQVVDWFGTLGVSGTSTVILRSLLSITASWVLLFLLYALMPNTRVSVRAAVIGALVASLMWEFAKFGFQVYVVTAVPYSAFYGSLGIIPLFLFWIYVTWLIVLFGVILTYTLQTYRGRRPGRDDWEERGLLRGDPDWMLPVMAEVASAFQSGRTIGFQSLADQLSLSSSVVSEMAHKLIEAGLLLRVSASAGDEDALTLAKPAETILISQILELAHRSRPTNDHPAWRELADLKRAEREAASERTLADLVGE